MNEYLHKKTNSSSVLFLVLSASYFIIQFLIKQAIFSHLIHYNMMLIFVVLKFLPLVAKSRTTSLVLKFLQHFDTVDSFLLKQSFIQQTHTLYCPPIKSWLKKKLLYGFMIEYHVVNAASLSTRAHATFQDVLKWFKAKCIF